jgi:hypothetical protein
MRVDFCSGKAEVRRLAGGKSRADNEAMAEKPLQDG